jgi:hypothetical protein
MAPTRRCTPSWRPTTACTGNVNQFAIDVNSDAIATAVITFANDTSSVNSLTAAAAGKRVAGPIAPAKDAHGNALR